MPSRRRLQSLLALVAASLFCVALVAVRAAATGSGDHVWLVWNLVLAWLPLALAIGLYDAHRRGSTAVVLVPLAAAWLLFFPNAPYILTDFVHLEPNHVVPLWFDAVLIAAFAFVGLLLGFVSLYLVQTVVGERRGARLAWATVVGALALSSVGIYLGRFVRVNSWDVITRPDFLVTIARLRLADPLGNPRLIVVSVLFTAFLTVTYAALYAAVAAARDLGADAPRRPVATAAGPRPRPQP